MVNDVEVGDAVEEEVAHPAEKVAVERCGSTTGKRPLFSTVVRKLRIGVVEVGDHDKPVIHTQPRNAVVLHDVGETVLQRCELYSVNHGKYSNVGNDDDVALALCKDNGVGYR